MDNVKEVVARGIYRAYSQEDAWDKERQDLRNVFMSRAEKVLAWLDTNGLQVAKKQAPTPRKRVFVPTKDDETSIEEPDDDDE